MTRMEVELIELFEEMARKHFSGHFTIMRFSTNWRASFVTPAEYENFSESYVGLTLAHAVTTALRAKYLIVRDDTINQKLDAIGGLYGEPQIASK
ncbi:hypothetical protein GGR33_004261 [Methylobacterium brachythecii]|uniref:Uncharacterized protein n=1 Tax=Methylobacterium brachythecii TaxID=1176177 RepID=A0A7W6ALD2_9HYPH|nr:hypothetical protein [Methylobacterium brachythecii]GLS45587.1 hypothetical protein GCM10007884_35780 [Methylobacterium brachythecii]